MDDLGKTSLVGHTLAHYRISTVIGAGGMGQVYRATDTKLARDIALKVLPSDMASDPDRLTRFQREARAVAALNHPNIVTVYSVEESDNLHFITMELIEGQPLDRLIPANGLPADRIIEIAGAIAEALAAAHEKGIVHRDLKPANVMVTNEGRVKVLDFGLAKAKDVGAETADDATLTLAGRTQAGMVMGTPAYMSPEQVSGRPLDHRSDIFSFGVVLHEMATGRRPFKGSSSAELISSILRDTPPSVIDARPELPSDLARVIRRCLEKDPRYRMQTARDVSNEFRDMSRTITHHTPLSTSPAHTSVAADSGAARADEGFWVAVLPFKCASASAEIKALADGLTEEIVAGLSRFSYLRVITSGSTKRYADQSPDLRVVGKELGARYVMTGNLRQVGARLRVAVQLVDATSGAQLWSETYERPFNAEAIFELQDELVPRIVSTAADMHGVLPRSMSAAVRFKASDQLTPYEALLRGFGHSASFSADNIVEVQTCLERALQQSPGNADCLAMLAAVQCDAYGVCDQVAADTLEEALRAAQAAVEAAPTNALAYHALARVLFFKRNVPAFRAAAERAISLNPMDGATIAYMGILMAFAGDWERGCALTEKGMQLNANHPGWHCMTAWHDAYRRKDYPKALELALKLNAPKNPWVQRSLTVSYAQLGRSAEARSSLRDLLALVPNYARVAREMHSRWLEPELVEHMMDGLRKAGLEIPEIRTPAVQEISTSPSSPGKTRDSGASRADEGFWVAVLPFKYTGGNADLTALAEGLTEDIVMGLSRFSYLRVMSRSATLRTPSDAEARSAGKELGARYVMEGSLRHAGSKLRIAVQLVDTNSGAHLWAENYERAFHAESLFELQDDIAPRIVSTCGDSFGVLARSISDAVRGKASGQLTPYEALMRGFGYHHRLTPEEHAEARELLERAVEQAPGNADCWAMLSWVYSHEYGHGFNPRPGSLDRSLAASRRAVELAPSNHLAQQALAVALFFRKEKASCLNAAERALALNPWDGSNEAIFLITFTGDWERGCTLIKRSMELNPHHPGWYWLVLSVNEYRTSNYRAAVDAAVRAAAPDIHWTNFLRAAAYGQLGDSEAAQKALHQLLAIRPDYAAEAREDLGKWLESELVEHIIDGLRKAGLDVPGDSVAQPAKPTPR